MPAGSSSEAPVTSPGPRTPRKRLSRDGSRIGHRFRMRAAGDFLRDDILHLRGQRTTVGLEQTVRLFRSDDALAKLAARAVIDIDQENGTTPPRSSPRMQ